MPSFDYDFQYFKAGIQGLEQYLLTADVYWPLGVNAPAGEPPYPLLTLGSLLLAHRRLKALDLDTSQEAAFQKHTAELHALQTRWRVTWENKAAREFSARLRLWGDYLEELRAQPENHGDRYAYEVSRRVMLALLQDETVDLPKAETDLLSGLDGLLKALFAPGIFIWDEVYQSVFPQPTFWYLYGSFRRDQEN